MSKVEGVVFPGESGEGMFRVGINTGEHSFLMDEPAAFGGMSSGPSPFELLGAALSACTLMTLKLYAQRKGWTLDRLSVRVTHKKGSPDARDRFERAIDLGEVTDEQRERLLDIAERCPVHLLLERGADVSTTIAEEPLAGPKEEGLHERVIDELCRDAA